MIGFVSAVVGMLIGMFVSSVAFGAVPLVSIIGAFFTGGVAGIMGNATGGRRGAIISGVIYGFLLIVGSAFLSTLFDLAAYGATGVGHDCLDVMVIMTLMKRPLVGIVVILVAFAVMCVVQSRNKKNNFSER